MITDYLLGSLSVVFALKTFTANRSDPQRSRNLWAWAFVSLAVASFSGGTHHGFSQYLGTIGLQITWKISMLALGALSFFLFWASTISTFRKKISRIITFLGMIVFAFYLFVLIRNDDFLYAILGYLSSMIYLLGSQIYSWVVRRERSAPWIIVGIVVSLIAARIQQSGVSLSQHFNHNDLYHVVQMVSVYFLYRGGKLLSDFPASPN